VLGATPRACGSHLFQAQSIRRSADEDVGPDETHNIGTFVVHEGSDQFGSTIGHNWRSGGEFGGGEAMGSQHRRRWAPERWPHRSPPRGPTPAHNPFDIWPHTK
jgi:hypothetical protein